MALSDREAEMSCAFESCTSYVSGFVISVCSGRSSKQRVAVTEMCPQNKEVKIRRVQRLEMVFCFPYTAFPDSIKTFLSMLYSLMFFLVVFM